MADVDERQEELSALAAIYLELEFDPADQSSARLSLPVTPAKPLHVRFVPSKSAPGKKSNTDLRATSNSTAYIEHDVELAHLPPLQLHLTLPDGYPSNSPPVVRLTAIQDWLPRADLDELEKIAATLWTELGKCSVLYDYIDHLQEAAYRGFDVDQSTDGCLVLPFDAAEQLVAFDSEAEQAAFNTGTFNCGICLEPKRGSFCYKIKNCGHVFCRQCLQDFYNNAVSEGDVASVKCLSPDCGKEDITPGKKKYCKRKPALHPRELLAMGIEESVARRYVEMKRKKKLEADKTTIYCPRTWCQGPAKNAKYPPIPSDLTTYEEYESSLEDESDEELTKVETSQNKNHAKIPPDPADRLAVCEKCSLAFCKVCYMGWHGPYVRCYPRDPNDLSAEEKASYDYIRLNTSPCPTCSSPTQKTMGCNHMNCFQCNTHFCYLCSAWLYSDNPYEHFNKPGTECYQRLWELEEGDEGRAPADGRGFAGARHWEQLALEAARDAQAQEMRPLLCRLRRPRERQGNSSRLMRRQKTHPQAMLLTKWSKCSLMTREKQRTV